MRVSAYRIIPKRGDIELAVWNHYIDRPYIPPTIRFGSIMLEMFGLETLTLAVDSQVARVWKILIDQSRRLSREIMFLVPTNTIYYGDNVLHYAKNATPAEILEDLEEIEGFYV